MLPESLPLSRLRLRDFQKEELDTALLVKLCSGLIVGDFQVAEAALSQAQGLEVNSKVATPFGGASLFPLQAAVCAPLAPAMALWVAQRLLMLGANPNIAWRDCGGQHTPLSKALALRNFRLAELLWQQGADCTAALLRTDLLEGSRFDPVLVKWLLDHDADVATALHPVSCHAAGCSRAAAAVSSRSRGSSSRASDASSSSNSSSGVLEAGACCRCGPPVPAVAVVLQKLGRELHVSRQLSKLHVAAGSGQEQWLLRRAADSLTLLLAAGAAPAGAPDPSGAVAAAVAGLAAGDWGAVRQAACCPLCWSPATHHLFPRAFQRAAREVLLVGRRGFGVPSASGGSSGGGGSKGAAGNGGGGNEGSGQQQPRITYWMDGNILLTIVKHCTPAASCECPLA